MPGELEDLRAFFSNTSHISVRFGQKALKLCHIVILRNLGQNVKLLHFGWVAENEGGRTSAKAFDVASDGKERRCGALV